MATIAYTNISPITITYNNINHFIYIKNHFKPKKLYVCVWDNYILEDKRFSAGLDEGDKREKLRENIEFLEKILSYLKLDYRIIYLSEAWDRLLKNSRLSSYFQKIMANINMEDVIRESKTRYLYLKEVTFSKINYIIADYLVACNLPSLFPEICSSVPTKYIGLYIKLFENTIDKLMEEQGSQKRPDILLVNNAPVFMHKKDGLIPSKGMSFQEIKRIFKSCFDSGDIGEKETNDFLSALSEILGKGGFECDGHKMSIDETISQLSQNLKNEDLVLNTLSNNLMKYYLTLEAISKRSKTSVKDTTLYIKDHKQYNLYLGNLNSMKLRILKFCDGKSSSLDISKKASLNLSTVSTYLSRLKNSNLITNEKKPRRKIDNMVINFDNLEES